MAVSFRTPTEIAEQYLNHLKGLKPEINKDQVDSDWWIRSRVVGGTMAGLYSDQRKIADDAFPQSARHEALEKHLDLYFGSGFLAAQQAEGDVSVTGTPSTTVPLGTQFLYDPNGNVYQSTAAVTLVGTTGSVPVKSVSAGQNQNLAVGAFLTISSPPIGINSTAQVRSPGLTDGRDDETDDEASARILARVRTPPAGGTVSDYDAFARAASPSVTDVNVVRYIFGLGTVGVVITAGTTNIDDAVTNGDPVIRVPSPALVTTVQSYIDAVKPLTDCAHVLPAIEVPQDVTFRVKYLEGDGTTVPTGQTLTQKQLVEREIRRAIYKTPPGGRKIQSASGVILASEIEEVVDLGLSADPYTIGSFAQIVSDRQCDDLTTSGTNRLLLDHEIVIPGTITVIEGIF